MEQGIMKIRAVIFDVYGTLLEVGAPPSNADVRWQKLFEEMLGTPPPLHRTEFSVRAGQIIAHRHAAARTSGIQWPEIVWPSVVLEVLPMLVRLSAKKRDEFLLRQMQIGRTLRLADGAAECLRQLNDNAILLGIASNSQAYTLRELTAALQGNGLNFSMFDHDLSFWSFEHGFSKPDPHVFRILTARLEARGIRPAETLMVGDRLDNDIEPAKVHGWRTWQLGAQADGSWTELLDWWQRSNRNAI
jgi:FMN phosphatase YigB (HAD superfamily)